MTNPSVPSLLTGLLIVAGAVARKEGSSTRLKRVPDLIPAATGVKHLGSVRHHHPATLNAIPYLNCF